MKVLLTAVLLLLACADARADTLLLHDGRVLVGPRVEQTADGVTVHFEHGAVRIQAAEVLSRYDEGDPEAQIQAKGARRHRMWRNRYKEESPHFRFETTMSRPVFSLHRDRLLDYHAALLTELKAESHDGPTVKACLHKDAREFQQIGGASAGVGASFRFVPPQELVSFDDPARRPTCLRALQWATASHGIGLAFPGLPHGNPIYGALIDYYGAAEPQGDDPTRFRFGLPVGMFCEILRHDVAGGLEAGLERMEDGRRTQRYAWTWAIVHFLMQDAERRTAFLERLRQIDAAGPPDPATLLELEDGPDLAKALKDHVASLQPTTAVDWIAAGRAAEHRKERVRARSHYAEALALVPRDPEALRCVAALTEVAGPSEEGVSTWRAYLAVAPLDVEARESLARCLEWSGLAADGEREVKLAEEIRQALAAPTAR